MKITILQQDIVWAKPAVNCQAAERAIAANPGSDLYVLPEMFSTGFATRPAGIAEADGGSLQWMQATARATGAAICGSIATEDGGRYYNRFYFVEPDGRVTTYDKRHLFTFGGEDKTFTAGTRRPIISYRGLRFLPEVCYDLRFPVWARNGHYATDQCYDLIIYVASWPQVRQQAWDTLLRARAIENQCFVAGVNRVGADPGNVYAGGSVVLDPWGNTLVRCPDGEPSAATATLDLPALEAFRQSFPVLNDRDEFSLSS